MTHCGSEKKDALKGGGGTSEGGRYGTAKKLRIEIHLMEKAWLTRTENQSTNRGDGRRRTFKEEQDR